MSGYEVIVVGAGPSGTACAIELAGHGARVLLVDQDRFPRDKACGEGMQPSGVRELSELGLFEKVRSFGHALDGITFVGPGGSPRVSARYPSSALASGQGLGVRRLRLDDHLVSHAASLPGVTLRQGWPVSNLLWNGRRVTGVISGSDRERAPLVVGADGLKSTVRRLAGLEGRAPRLRRYGVQGHFELAGSARPPEGVETSLLERAEGEVYLTPVGEAEVNVACLVPEPMAERVRGDLEAGIRDLIARAPGPRVRLRGAKRSSQIRLVGPFGAASLGVAVDGAVLVGDAAGSLDGISGQGMSAALATGRMAARAALRALEHGGPVRESFEGYEAARRRKLRDRALLTRAMLLMTQHPWLERVGLEVLARQPSLYGRLVAVAGGQVSLLGALQR